MELYASGFNAWNQLHFDHHSNTASPPPEKTEPDDIHAFTCVLRDEVIDHVRPFLSYTLVNSRPMGLRSAGMIPKGREEAALRIRTAGDDEIPTNFVEASNGIVVAYDNATNSITQHPSIHDPISNTDNKTSFSLPQGQAITQLVSYSTGFAALSTSGQVYTWGAADERYAACLGREVDPQNPATVPSHVPDLADLPTGPTRKLSAGGYTLAALTAGNDLYIWGQPSPASASKSSPTILADYLTDRPTPVDINNKDIADIAIGDDHLLALTTDNELYVVGDNSSGQLGFPPDTKSFIGEWTLVHIPGVEQGGKSIAAVVAGPRNSFVIVRSNDTYRFGRKEKVNKSLN
ncbi:regulator of chromosome condensation 1/beta-lactamase-inhibitor protein II [Apodospora peruviana]|uniref:Regulator of chromosome condensation 1/beta-lactamase-inhibitor protein II n=1 Tax=Apodospora peruviana TaxID=516989 RepID=A0AAE0HYP2_9PEZI|nr:regulator of chromosome condensation 1/beta-lactamase-inhibitor protein II [Apodospora peruviana]